MRLARFCLGMYLLLMTGLASAQLELHLAYMSERPGSKPAHFPNDHLFKFMSVVPYISADALQAAKIVKSPDGVAVEVSISTESRRRFNSLAASNVKAQERNDFAAHTGLAVVLNGRPEMVIQGVFQTLPKNALWLNLGAGIWESEALKRAQVWADAVNKKANAALKAK